MKNKIFSARNIEHILTIICILLFSFLLLSCTDSFEKLKRVGKAPDLDKIEVPHLAADDEDPKVIAAAYEDRKKRTNSLWQPGSTSFFRDNRAWKVGDIVKVVVKISDSAQLDNSSKNSRAATESLAVPSLFGKQKALAKVLSDTGDASNLVSANSSKNHAGTGGISRKEAIQTVMAAVVTQILKNGNLVIQGKQEIRVNHELREIKVSGIIRPRDISSENSVSSDQIAEARISYGGRGMISDVQQPRVGSQVLDILAPF
ncbi:MAG: flagellar basal body L-ring protein FlgH [Rickettsiaceae bacterium]|nr:flagellar basal body L-ring protein FlgH [Rickettsiaceae bacterium]